MGSDNYVESLDVDELKDIALYLNFDMLGSPNPGYFTYDGDQSAPPDPREGDAARAGGLGGHRAHLVAYLKGAGEDRRRTPSFDGRSDYDGFTQAGVPAGGLFSGAEEKMTGEQAELWGGKADRAVRPELPQGHRHPGPHRPHGTGDQRRAVSRYVVGLYAQDQRGRNGVPIRDDRTRHVLSES